MLQFFANHEIDAPVFAQDMLTIGYEIVPPIDEPVPIDNDAEFPNFNEVVEEDEVVDNVFMDRENIESNDFEDDVVGKSNEDDAANSENSKERNESANNDDNLLLSDNEEVPIERKHQTHFNIEDQIPYFNLGVTFANASKVRESITKYCISRVVA